MATLRLGAHQAAWAASSGSDPEPDSGAGSGIPAILVVDDDPNIRECLQVLLEDEGYTVYLAEHGRAALAVLERIKRPSLLLVDILMPVMNGVELIDALKQEPRFAALPIVTFSAASTMALRPDIPLLSKPIGIDALLSAVEKYRLR